MTDQPLIPTPLKAALCATCLAFAAWSGAKSLAAISHFRATGYLEAWQNQHKNTPHYQTPAAEFEQGLAASQRALTLVPYNSNYHSTVADMLLWQLLTQPQLSTADKQKLRTEAIQHYQEAIKRQPFWAFHYAHFAEVKAMLGETDNDMMTALHNANRYGAYEPYVMHVIIDWGLRLWPHMDTPTRLLIAQNIDKISTLATPPSEAAKERVFALGAVGLYQRAADVCPLLKAQSEQIAMMCKFTTKPNSAKAHK